MTIEQIDALWKFPLLIVVISGVWFTIKYKMNVRKTWYWHMMATVVWFVDAGISAVRDDTLWVIIGSVLGSLGMFNWFIQYHQVQQDKQSALERELREARSDFFEAFRIDDQDK